MTTVSNTHTAGQTLNENRRPPSLSNYTVEILYALDTRAPREAVALFRLIAGTRVPLLLAGVLLGPAFVWRGERAPGPWGRARP